MKKIITLLLVFSMLIGYLPNQVNANETEVVNQITITNEIDAFNELESRIKTALLNGETSVDISDLELTRNEYPKLSDIQYYSPYLSNGIEVTVYYYSDGIYAFVGISNEMSIAETQSHFNRIDNFLRVYDSEMVLASNDFEKAMIIHDKLVYNFEYDIDNLNNGTLTTDSYTSGGLFINKKGVCQSYAYAYMYLMNRYGVECHVTSSEAMNHAWNIIKINNDYYHVDVTWDDPVYDKLGYVGHTYFLKSDSSILNHNGWDSEIVCSNTKYDNAYFNTIDSQIIVLNDFYYYFDNGKFIERNKLTNETTELFSLNQWIVGNYYVGIHTGLFYSDGYFYYNTQDGIYRYNVNANINEIILEPELNGQYIFGTKSKNFGFYYLLKSDVNDRGEVYSIDYAYEVAPNQVTKITANPISSNIKVGETVQLSITYEPIDAILRNLSYSSTNENVAIVDQNGKVTGVGSGSASIIVTADSGANAIVQVNVEEEIKATSITISPVYTELMIGEGLQLTVNPNPSEAVLDKIYWQSTNENIASVDTNGYVIAHKAGDVTIIASTDTGLTTEATIIVKGPIESLQLNAASLCLNQNEVYNLNVTISPEYTYDDTTIYWTSSNRNVAIVDSSGKVIAVSPGTTKITATTVRGLTTNCYVTVKSNLPEYTPQVVDYDMIYEIYDDVRKFVYELSPTPGEMISDKALVIYLLALNNELFDNYLVDNTYRIPYDLFMYYADYYFYKHSDLKDYLKSYDYYDEELDMINYPQGGFGWLEAHTLLGIEKEGDFFKVYIKEEVSDTVQYYLLTLICTENYGLNIYGVEELVSYEEYDQFYFSDDEIHLDNGKSYYRVNITNEHSSVDVKNLVTLEGIDGLWLEEGKELEFTIACDEGYKISSVIVNYNRLENTTNAYKLENPNERVNIQIYTKEDKPIELLEYVPQEVSDELLKDYFDSWPLFISDLEPGGVAADDQVFNYMVYYKEYLFEEYMDGSYLVVPYDVFMYYVDCYFYNHSDMKEFLNEYGWYNENTNMIICQLGGYGGADDYKTLGVEKEGDFYKIYIERTFLPDNSITYLVMTLACTEDYGLNIYALEQIDAYNGHKQYVQEDNVKHYDNGKSYYKVNVTSEKATVNIDNLTVLDGVDGQWLEEGNNLMFSISTDENFFVSSVYVNGQKTNEIKEKYSFVHPLETITIEVYTETHIPIETININNENTSLDINETIQLEVTFNPSNTTYSKVLKWESSNTDVAIVDENGNVTSIGVGEAIITATTVNNKTAIYSIKVEHEWDEGIVTIEPTEETKGLKVYTCQKCKETKEEIISKLPHTHKYGEWTDNDKYSHKKVCSCGSVITEEHIWNEGVIEIEPTEETKGLKIYSCQKCSETKNEILDKLEHTHKYSEWETILNPTCTENGFKEKKCSCGDAIIEKIAKLGHQEVVDSKVEATCSQTGLTEGKHCERCNTILVEQEIIEKLNHTWNEGIITKEPTQTNEGEKTYTCEVCHETKTEALPKLPVVQKDGWQQIDGTWYYYKDGSKVTGWLQLGSTWYYMDANGAMVTGTKVIDGRENLFTSDGAWLGYATTKSGWVQENGTWYYYKDGEKVTGWFQEGNTWYYFNSNGAMHIGWLQLGSTWYYMDANGAMVSGWQQIGFTWYYFNPSGAMHIGWLQIGSTWYYMDANGAMVTGWQQIGSTWYYFNTDGAMHTGWLQIGSTWYYIDANGAIVTGWQQIGSTWYYFNTDGAMQTGWLQIGSTWYYMDANGAMVTGKQVINGTTYKFNSSGEWIA